MTSDVERKWMDVANQNALEREQFAKEARAWEDTAAQFARNADYYRGLVVEIGKMFGESAYIADDGSKQQDVLCAKVPELVRAAVDAVRGSK